MNKARIQYADRLIQQAKSEVKKRDFRLAWKQMEEAHIFSQPFARLHFYVHWEMLILALRERSYREVFGQILRLIVAVPGYQLSVSPYRGEECNIRTHYRGV